MVWFENNVFTTLGKTGIGKQAAALKTGFFAIGTKATDETD